MEVRFLEGAELRAASKGRAIQGYAAVFGQQSSDLGGFRETIRPGAFARSIRSKQDVLALFNHDSYSILGRTSSGTLRLGEDGTGLAFEVDLPDTQLGRDVHTLVQRGDISQCSFSFHAVKDVWNRDGTARELMDVDLLDVSPVTNPAYPQTSVSARSAGGSSAVRSGTYVFRRHSQIYVPDVPVDDEMETERRRAMFRLQLMEEERQTL